MHAIPRRTRAPRRARNCLFGTLSHGNIVREVGELDQRVTRRCMRAPFDAFILDVQLPDGNGLDLIREV